MRKILQVNKLYDPWVGGVETVVKNIVDFLGEKYSIDVLAANEVPLAKTQKKLLSNLKSYCYKSFSFFFFINTPFSPLFFWMYKLMSKKYEIIHAHLPNPLFEFAFFIFGLAEDKKLIVTVHADLKETRFKHLFFVFKPILKKIYSSTDTIVVTSPQNFHNNKLLQNYSNKIKVIPLGINSKIEMYKFYGDRIRKEFNIKSDDFVFIYVGRLAEYKGLIYLIEAFKGVDGKLLIIGEGPLRSKIQKKIYQECLVDKIYLTGYRDDEWVSSAYRIAKAFVLPSISRAEAFGIVQVEAMKYGLPVINTKIGSGVNYVSIDGQTGISVSPKNVKELTKALNILISDFGQYKLYSENARLRSRLFTIENMISGYDELFSKT